MKRILLWQPDYLDRQPAFLLLDDVIASACVRAGVAAAVNPADTAGLNTGSAIDGSNPVEVLLQHGFAGDLTHVYLPTAVAAIGAGLGLCAAIGKRALDVVTAPKLTLAGPLAFAAGAAAATVVAMVGGVPAGVTPALTPNDGRLVIAGDATSGWKVVVGLTASSAGTIALAVSAAGATGANAAVTVTAAAGGAAITSPAAVTQPGATQRFFQAKADRLGTWAMATGGNAADFTVDATTGIYSVKAAAAGDGTAQVVKTLPLVFTPADGTGVVTQTVTVTLAPAEVPSVLSASSVNDFSGAAGKRLDQATGWTTNNGQPFYSAVFDGNGALTQGNNKNDAQSCVRQVSTLNNLTFTYRIATGDGTVGIIAASDGAGNELSLGLTTSGNTVNINFGTQFDIVQGGTRYQQNVGDISATIDPAKGYVDFQIKFSADANTVTLGFPSSNKFWSRTGPLALGKGFGFGFNQYTAWPMYGSARVMQVMSVVQATVLSVTSAPALSLSNTATWNLAWDTTFARPTAIQHQLYDLSGSVVTDWITGDSTINNDGTISYTGTARIGGSLLARFRPLNDIAVVAPAASRTRFLATPARFGANLVDSAGWSSAVSPQFQIFDNLFNQGYWQDPSNNYSYDVTGKVDADGMPLVSGLIRQIGHGPTSGETLELTWTGSPGMTIALNNTQGNTVLGSLSQPAAQTFRWTETFTYDGQSATFGGIRFLNIDTNNPPKNIKIRVVGQAAPQVLPFSDAYIAMAKSFSGTFRLMDVFRINLLTDGSATFAQHRQYIEWAITLANATGRDPYFNIPIYSSDAYVTAVIRAFDTGAGTSNGVGLAAGRKLHLAWGNEIWNVGAPVPQQYGILRTRYSQRTGQPEQADNAGGIGQVFAEHAYQHNKVMTVVEAAATNYAACIVRVVETQMGLYNYQTFKQNGGAHYDAHAQAPYFSVSTNPNKSPAALGPIWKQAAIDRITSLNAAAQETYADGKRFICYEAGPDFLADPTGGQCDLSAADRLAFKRSPQFYDVMRAYYKAWAEQYGDLMNVYTDIGLDTWGLMLYQGDPQAYGFVALVDAVAGNTAHRPTS